MSVYPPPAAVAPLDASVADPASGDPRRWRRAAVLAVVLTVALIVALGVVAGLTRPGVDVGAGLDVVAELALGAMLLAVARPVLPPRRLVRVLGLLPVRRSDLAAAVPGFVLQLVAQVVFTILVVAVDRHFSFSQASNTTGLDHAPVLALVLFGVAAVLVAPAVEETIFRGLVLRAGMASLGFWPAAVVSALLFGLFHTYEAATLAGAVVLGLHMTVFGGVQCVVARRTGRLAPCVAIHAASNLLAIVAVAASAR